LARPLPFMSYPRPRHCPEFHTILAVSSLVDRVNRSPRTSSFKNIRLTGGITM
jgi:hypothetical protein